MKTAYSKIVPRSHVARVILATAALLAIPLVAMQFTQEVAWTFSDFLVIGTLLLVTGLLIDLAWRKMGRNRVLGVLGILVLFFWLWAELAVGVFTNWGS